MAITRAQQYRQMLENGGRGISLQEAKDMAPKGEFLAYINKKEAKMLKDAGGSGIMTNAGIPSFIEYGSDDPDTFSQAASTGSVQGDVDRGGGGGDENNQREQRKREQRERERIAKEAAETFNKREIERKALERRKKMGAKYVTDMFDLPADYDEEKDDTAAMLDLFVNDPYREDRTKRTLPTALGIGLSLLEKPLQAGAKKTREFFSGPTTDIFGRKQKGVLAAGKFNYKGEPLTEERFANMSLTEKNQAYKDYMGQRLDNQIDAYGNPLNQGNDGPDNQILFSQNTTPGDGNDSEEEDVGLRLAFRANGGRIGLQEGGGIEQRLEQLGGDVSSAEQVLQAINERLQSAESSLGSGGGGIGGGLTSITQPLQQPGNVLGGQPNMSRPLLLDKINPDFKTGQPVEELKAADPNNQLGQLPLGPTELKLDQLFTGETFNQVPEEFRSGFAEYTKENPIGVGGQAMSSVMLPDGNRVMFGDTASAGAFRNYLKSTGFTSPSPLGQPLQSQGTSGVPALGFANGGRIGAAEGGIMDLETGRQMYFLGKLVKKATRAVKKVAKSPIGKAALLYAATAGLGAFGAGAARAGTGLGIFSPSNVLSNVGSSFLRFKGTPIGESIFGKAIGDTDMTRSGGLLNLIKDNPFGAITAASVVAGALTPAQENQAQQLADNTGIDIEEARNQILKAAAGQDDFRARAFKADGGIMRLGYQEGSKEPVAKKTMPLLDMGGKEMDLREDGGFVPIGRMEKADDVPARLSKNEFVFTADAVRNAGDGNVDKGAEVMYNMMKNLESGGDVSEESQGLSGAREMFQTSKRLEEVL
jgi:hypothetical protein